MYQNECQYLDNVVRRITAGIRLTYDDNPLINKGFQDLQIPFGLTQTLSGFSYPIEQEEIFFRQTDFNTKFLKTIFDLTEELNTNKTKETEEEKNQKIITTLGLDTTEIKSLPRNKINYVIRFNVCNTLAYLYGKDGLEIAHTLLNSKGCDNEREINGFYSCALSNKKEVSKIGLEILKKAGIIKVVEPEIKEKSQNNYKNYIKICLSKKYFFLFYWIRKTT
jgi:hypothetical protein